MIARFARLRLPFVCAAAVLCTGCTYVRIQSVADQTVTLSVRVPDGGSYTRIVEGARIVDVFSGRGGRYSVSILPDDAYRQTLVDVEREITDKLFSGSSNLSADQIKTLTNSLNIILDARKQFESAENPSCGGAVADFATAVVTVSRDLNGRLTIECGSSTEDE